MNLRRYSITVVLIAGISPLKAFGHAMWDNNAQALQARTNNNSQLKIAQCGGLPATVPGAGNTFVANQTLQVHWKETVQHLGHYMIQFSTGDESQWSTLIDVPDAQNSNLDLPHFYSVQITIPDISCDQCIIRLMQVMQDGPTNTYYYNCADIKITGGSGEPPPIGNPLPPGGEADCTHK